MRINGKCNNSQNTPVVFCFLQEPGPDYEKYHKYIKVRRDIFDSCFCFWGDVANPKALSSNFEKMPLAKIVKKSKLGKIINLKHKKGRNLNPKIKLFEIVYVKQKC